jgi:mRNA-degrading endonuclease RelE of RelBE toxin-antitoxin system
MDKIEKLLRKISEKDRQRLLGIVEKLVKGEIKKLNIRKVTNSDFYRLRSGRFRIIFHYEVREIIVDSIKLKNETTYNEL